MSPDTTSDSKYFRIRDEISLPRHRQVIHASAHRDDRYPILITRSTAQTVENLAALVKDAQVAIITDTTVETRYGETMRRRFEANGVAWQLFAMPPGEPSKSVEKAVLLWEWLAASNIGRRDFIVNWGGGVVADLGGWVASAFMRGVGYINLPTTLMAQVDGALGGKVGANHASAKNLLGAFYQPSGVISNVAWLATLTKRHMKAGLAEAIKKAIIASPAYWGFVTEHVDKILAQDLDVLEQLVRSATLIKTALIERDPYEQDLRRALNFGHAVGHPLETVCGYGNLLHGEAVAFGMVVECRIAANRGLLASAILDQLLELLDRVGLPRCADQLPAPVDLDVLLKAMKMVRLIRGGSLRYVLPVAFGQTLIADDVGDDELRVALAECGLRGRG